MQYGTTGFCMYNKLTRIILAASVCESEAVCITHCAKAKRAGKSSEQKKQAFKA